jgi:hypothetical protein
MPDNELDPRASTNIVYPQIEGVSNRFGRWRVGAVPTQAFGSANIPGVEEDVLDDGGGAGVHALPANLAVQGYPSYMLDFFDPDKTPTGDGPMNPVIPRALYGAITRVAGTWVPLYYAQFTSGQLNTAFAGDPPNPLGRMNSTGTSSTGHPNQAVLNDPTAILANPSTITDFCASLSAENQSYASAGLAEVGATQCEGGLNVDNDGDGARNDGCPAREGAAETACGADNTDNDGDGFFNDGCPVVGGLATRALNPATAGTHLTLNYTSSQRDMDNDSYENAFDTCPATAAANTDNPRTSQGADGDMIDPVCDVTADATSDNDKDTFANAQDNCPQTELTAYSPVVTLTNAETAADTSIEYTSAGDPLQVNDAIVLPDGGDVGTEKEIMKVLAINTGTNTATVLRGGYGTSAESQTAGSAVNHSQADQKDSEVGLDYSSSSMDGGPQGDTMGDQCDNQTATAYSPAATLTGAETAVDTAIGYTSAGDPITVGDMVSIDSEIMRVTAVNTTTNVLTVERGMGCTTAAAHAAAAPVLNGTSVKVTVNGKTVGFNQSTSCSNGHWHARGNVIPICYSTGPVDADGDGYCGPGTVGCTGACITDPLVTDSGGCASTVPPSCTVRHNAWSGGNLAPTGFFDTDRGGGDTTTAGDPGGVTTQIACPGGAADQCPETGFDSDWIETLAGTNPAQACPADGTPNNEPFDSWLYDVNDDGFADISDVSTLGGAPYNDFVNNIAGGGSVRYDFNADGVTDISDVSILGGTPYNKRCRRDDGTLGQPQ